MIANVRFFNTSEIMFYQDKLEYSRAKTIEEFMTLEVALDWEKNEVWTELAEILKATMFLFEGWWICK